MRHRVSYFIGIALILIAALVVRVLDPAPVAQLRAMVFDVFQQVSPRTYDPAAPVRIIDIDDVSIRKIGQWPWPRTVIAKLVDKLKEHGAAVVAFDIVFSEPDRSSPENSLSFLPPMPEAHEIRRMAKDLPAFDDLLAKSLAEMPTVLGIVLNDDMSNEMPGEKAAFAHAGDNPREFVPGFDGGLKNLSKFEAVVPGIGALNWTPDGDQIIRRIPLLFQSRGRLIPALSTEALRVAQGASTYIAKSSNASGEQAFGAKTGIVSIKVGEFVVPTDGEGQMWLHFTPSDLRRFIPAWKLIEDKLDASDVEGRIVLVGTSAAGLFDLRTTPLDVAVPGVEVHAQAIEQIIADSFLYRPDFALALELGYMLLVGMILAILILYTGAEWSGLLGGAVITAVMLASWQLFQRQAWLLDPLYPSMVAVAVYVFGTLMVYLQTEGERRRVRTAFSRYMSPELVARLADDPTKLVLGGEMRNMTVMFCDIRSFTSISEGLDAHELTRFVNRFLTPMTDIILSEKGTIDKYMGDCIMAFWNAPIDDPDHEKNACRAALRMIRALEDLNTKLRSEVEGDGRAFQQIDIGIGISTGECCVGNMGSDQRFDYSVIGDTVNVASRLEGQSKTYGLTTVLAETTVGQGGNLACLELDLISVKGRTKALRIFGLAGDEAEAEREAFVKLKAAHAAMLAAYRAQDWDGAEAALSRCRELDDGAFGPVYDLYENRIAEFRLNAPGADWDGVYVALTK